MTDQVQHPTPIDSEQDAELFMLSLAFFLSLPLATRRSFYEKLPELVELLPEWVYGDGSHVGAALDRLRKALELADEADTTWVLGSMPPEPSEGKVS